MQATVNGAQLNLQETVELQQKTLFDVIMEAANGEIFSVLQIGNSFWVLKEQLNQFKSQILHGILIGCGLRFVRNLL